MSYLLTFWVFRNASVVDSFQRLRMTVLAFVGAQGLGSLYTLREFQKAAFAGSYRPGYVAGDANLLCCGALLAIPLGLQPLGTERPHWERLFCLSCLGGDDSGLTVAASRGGFVGCAFPLLI